MAPKGDMGQMVVVKKVHFGSVIAGYRRSRKAGDQVGDYQDGLIEGAGTGGDADEGVYPTLQAGFFLKLTNGCLFRRFAAFHKSPRQAPHALFGRYATLHQQEPMVVINEYHAGCRHRVFIYGSLASGAV